MAHETIAKVANLKLALDWLRNFIEDCLRKRMGQADNFEVPPLRYYQNDPSLAGFIERHEPDADEFALLMLALAPHLQPDFFGKIIAEYLPDGGDFPEFGGVRGVNHRGLLPTGETAQFVIGGDDLEKRLDVQRHRRSRIAA